MPDGRNIWFDLLGYQEGHGSTGAGCSPGGQPTPSPMHGPPSVSVFVGSAATAPPGGGAPSPGAPSDGKHLFRSAGAYTTFALIFMAFGAGIALAAYEISRRRDAEARPVPPGPTPVEPRTVTEGLAALQISGAIDDAEAERLAGIAGSEAATRAINDPSHRSEYPPDPTRPRRSFVLQPRRGHEGAFRAFMADPRARALRVDVVHVPLGVGARLDGFLDRWAATCRVTPRMIRAWSHLRGHESARLKPNECAPGGECIVISVGCDDSTFAVLPEGGVP